jgi:hypothetical protein
MYGDPFGAVDLRRARLVGGEARGDERRRRRGQREPLTGAVRIEARDIERALVEQVAVRGARAGVAAAKLRSRDGFEFQKIDWLGSDPIIRT